MNRKWLVDNMDFPSSFIEKAVGILKKHSFITEDKKGFFLLNIDEDSTIDIDGIPEKLRDTFVRQGLTEVRRRFRHGKRETQYHDGVFFAADKKHWPEFRRRVKGVIHAMAAEFNQKSDKNDEIVLCMCSLVGLTK